MRQACGVAFHILFRNIVIASRGCSRTPVCTPKFIIYFTIIKRYLIVLRYVIHQFCAHIRLFIISIRIRLFILYLFKKSTVKCDT